MSSIDYFVNIQKCWVTTVDIMKICCCDNLKANEILKQLEMDAKLSDEYISNTECEILIPMQLFLKYIGEDKVNRIIRYHESLIRFGL